MRIRSHIFISVFLATVVPLVALALAASYYSEYSYQREIKREIINSLNSVTIEISHELQNTRNLVLGISRATAIKSFLPILQSAAKDENHPSVLCCEKKLIAILKAFKRLFREALIFAYLITVAIP